MILPLFYDDVPYRIVKDGDPVARAIMNRHYSRRKHGNLSSRQFCASGENQVILGTHADWVFIWRYAQYRLDEFAGWLECFAFRNEGPTLASATILLCETVARQRWGPVPMFTYVDPTEVASSNPGGCFQAAGWKRRKKRSSKGLICYTKTADCMGTDGKGDGNA